MMLQMVNVIIIASSQSILLTIVPNDYHDQQYRDQHRYTGNNSYYCQGLWFTQIQQCYPKAHNTGLLGSIMPYND